MLNYLSAFNEFKKCFLIDGKSIFTGKNILNNKGIEYLKKYFIHNGISGGESFIKKLAVQLNSADAEVYKQAVEVIAHAVWLWRLVPYNASLEGRLKAVNEILKLIDINIDKDHDSYKKWFTNIDKGFAATGTYFNTNKPFELAFIIEYFEKFLESEEKAKEWVLNESEGTEKQVITEDKKLVSKQVAMKNALMHLTDSEQYEPILSFNHKSEIASSFSHLIDDSKKEESLSHKIKIIKSKLIDSMGGSDAFHFFYSPNIRPLWDAGAMPIETNTIYYGPPGTGKTYLTVKAAKANIVFHKGNVDEQLCIVQFHPSFGYEDFIDGLKPELINGNVSLSLKNGVFKEFCIKAARALRDHRQDPLKKDIPPPRYYFIIDEINRADLSAVFGEVLSCIEENKRIDFNGDGCIDEESNEMLLIKTQNSHLIERDKDAIHKAKNGEYKFGIPSNIVFIGTMNDIDRSVDTFDFALRRRFTWIYKGFDEEVLADCDALKDLDLEDVEKYIDSCKALNKYITEVLSLGNSYEIGHSYFMKISVRNRKISEVSKKELFERHFEPLLHEYIRSTYSPKEVSNKLREALRIFVNEK